MSPLSRDQSAILPETFQVVYRTRRCTGAPSDAYPAYYVSKVELADLTPSDGYVSSDLTGFPDTNLTMRDSAVALFNIGTADPTNKTALDDLAKQWAQDYLDWVTADAPGDLQYVGIVAPEASTLIDTIEWTYTAEMVATRVVGAPFSGFMPEEFQHFDPATSACVDEENAATTDFTPAIVMEIPIDTGGTSISALAKVSLEGGRLVSNYMRMVDLTGCGCTTDSGCAVCVKVIGCGIVLVGASVSLSATGIGAVTVTSGGVGYHYIVTSLTLTNIGSGGTPGTYDLGVSGIGAPEATGTYTIGGTGSITSLVRSTGGKYISNSPPSISFPSGGISGATAEAAMIPNAPTVTFTGGNITGISATAVLDDSGHVDHVVVTNNGTSTAGTEVVPTVGFSGGSPTTLATATASLATGSFGSGTTASQSVDTNAFLTFSAGSGGTPGTYAIGFNGGGNPEATGNYTIGSGGSITSYTIATGGTYGTGKPPIVSFPGGGITGASAVAKMINGCAKISVPKAGAYRATASYSGFVTKFADVGALCPLGEGLVVLNSGSGLLTLSATINGCSPSGSHPVTVTMTQNSPGTFSTSVILDSSESKTVLLQSTSAHNFRYTVSYSSPNFLTENHTNVIISNSCNEVVDLGGLQCDGLDTFFYTNLDTIVPIPSSLTASCSGAAFFGVSTVILQKDPIPRECSTATYGWDGCGAGSGNSVSIHLGIHSGSCISDLSLQTPDQLGGLFGEVVTNASDCQEHAGVTSQTYQFFTTSFSVLSISPLVVSANVQSVAPHDINDPPLTGTLLIS